MPRVTVVMAAYNAAQFLREAVASVLAQTYRDFELIVIDDASSDDSLSILQSFGDARMRIISGARPRPLCGGRTRRQGRPGGCVVGICEVPAEYSPASGDLRLRIFGDTGIVSVPNCWDYGSPIYIDRRTPVSWRERHPQKAQVLGIRPLIPLVRPSEFAYSRRGGLKMDFARGLAELSDATVEHRSARLSSRWCLHVTELALAMAAADGVQQEMTTTFPPIAPMPWAI